MGFESLLDQEHVCRLLTGYLRSGRVANAYLFAGPEGVGKRRAAKLFAQALNCSSEGDVPCGVCDSCVAGESERHPDVLRVGPERGSMTIGIDQIRSLKNAVSLRPSWGGFKVVIISEADRMTQEAANALLKTLEEPPEKTTLILTTAMSDALPRTILSRCQRIPFGLVRPETIARILIDSLTFSPKDAEIWAGLPAGRLGLALREAQAGEFKLRESALLSLMKVFRGEESAVTMAGALAEMAAKAQDGMRREAAEVVKRLKDEHPEAETGIAEEKIEAGAQARYRAWLEEFLDCFNVWVRDALVHSYAPRPELLINKDHVQDIAEMSHLRSRKRLIQILEAGVKARERLAANVQLRFLFEGLFLEIAEENAT